MKLIRLMAANKRRGDFWLTQNQRAGLDNPASSHYLKIMMMILSIKTRTLKPLTKFGILLLSAFTGDWERSRNSIIKKELTLLIFMLYCNHQGRSYSPASF